MCGRVKVSGLTVSHGEIVSVISKNKLNLRWGHNHIFNARLESLDSTWKDVKRNTAILPVTGFFEGSKLFVLPDGELFGLIGIYDHSDIFYILTQRAESPFSSYHERMPIPISMLGFNDYTDYSLITKVKKSSLFITY